MFERVRRLFKAATVDEYIRDVATILLREGFDPVDLEELKTDKALDESSRVFRLLMEQKLRPEDAAHAIRLSTHLYRTTCAMAEVRGWPLKDEQSVHQCVPRHAAYFLELLREAASRCDTTFRPRPD